MGKESEILLSTNLPIGKRHSGKVRDIYDLGDKLLIVTTDRLSAFDVVLPDGIPFKGYVLNKLSILWMEKTRHIIANHFLADDVGQYPPECQPYAELLKWRSMLVKKAKPLTAECIVRGYISGSAWKDYKNGLPICGITLPTGLVESQKLPEAIFTPSTKAPDGEHDINIPYSDMIARVGGIASAIAKNACLDIYNYASDQARNAGIIIADTKMEFGIDEEGHVILIDELLTPDSSRFWPAGAYRPGGPQPSFDKQFVRDYLESIEWNKQPPAPELPPEIIKKTSQKYMDAYIKLLKIL